MSLDFLNDQPNSELTEKVRVELKKLVSVGDTKTFMFGLGNDDSAYNNDGEYNGSDSREIVASTLWRHVEDAVVGEFGEGQNMFSKTWLNTGPRDPINDLGYFPNKRDAQNAIDNNVVTKASWQKVYPHLSNIYNSTITQPEGYHYVPLIEVEEIKEGRKVVGYRPVSKVLVKMNGPKNRDGKLIGQFGALIDAMAGFDNAYGRVIKVKCTGEPSNYYVYTPVMSEPINTEELDGYIQELVELNGKFWKEAIFDVNNGGTFDPDNVREYLLSITRFDTWEDFVARYNIRAEVGSKKLKKVQTVNSEPTEEDVAM